MKIEYADFYFNCFKNRTFVLKCKDASIGSVFFGAVALGEQYVKIILIRHEHARRGSVNDGGSLGLYFHVPGCRCLCLCHERGEVIRRVRSIPANPLTRMSVNYQLILLFLLMVSPVFMLQWYGNMKAMPPFSEIRSNPCHIRLYALAFLNFHTLKNHQSF
ncbi:hypothetical protein [Paenibacillus tyrfis]|uniref:hypothetical protein n=1 Tax=Paenibacillus tyrfis TaxID=1501230 RepID=UPI00209E7EB0|nr:hypothetical protein [Paenibacillus tyrfis]MCP1308869.1 hypothetical protein [Paenibacillus tyrfis]